MVEIDSDGGPKYRSKMCINDDEAKHGMGCISERAQAEKFHIQIIFGGVLLYGCTVKHILAYFRIVLGVLKHHYATLKLKK